MPDRKSQAASGIPNPVRLCHASAGGHLPFRNFPGPPRAPGKDGDAGSQHSSGPKPGSGSCGSGPCVFFLGAFSLFSVFFSFFPFSPFCLSFFFSFFFFPCSSSSPLFYLDFGGNALGCSEEGGKGGIPQVARGSPRRPKRPNIGVGSLLKEIKGSCSGANSALSRE